MRTFLLLLSALAVLAWSVPLPAQQGEDEVPVYGEEGVDGVTRATMPSGGGTEGDDEGGCDCGTRGAGPGTLGLPVLLGLALLRRRRHD